MTTRSELLDIIACAYQIAGAHDAPAHILDVLANPELVTRAQIDAMLPYTPSSKSSVELWQDYLQAVSNEMFVKTGERP